MCEHGFIGACAECDGSGQWPECDEESVRDGTGSGGEKEEEGEGMKLTRMPKAVLSRLASIEDRLDNLENRDTSCAFTKEVEELKKKLPPPPPPVHRIDDKEWWEEYFKQHPEKS